MQQLVELIEKMPPELVLFGIVSIGITGGLFAAWLQGLRWKKWEKDTKKQDSK